MNKIIKITFAALAGALLFCGCIKETIPQEGAATSGQISGTSSAIASMVNSIPAAMLNRNVVPVNGRFDADFGYPGLCMAREVMGQDISISYSYYDWFRWYAQNQSLDDQHIFAALGWYCFTPWIKSCNDIIGIIDPSAMTPETEGYLGIAHAYRALFYLDFSRMYIYKGENPSEKYSGVTVPIVTELTSEDASGNNPRATIEETYRFILSDVEKAITYLENYSRTTKTMPDLAAAYGVGARTYLAMSEYDPANYALAAQYARMAINASNCVPMNQQEMLDPIKGFNDMTSNRAWMWATSLSTENSVPLVTFAAHMCPEVVFGYATAETNEFRIIDRSLYESITDGDFRKYLWLSPDRSIYNYQSIVPDSYLGSPFLDAMADYTQLKFRPGNGNYSEYQTACAVDYPIMRIEEMYLIEAEATAYTSPSEGKRLLESFMNTYRMESGKTYTCRSSNFEGVQQEVLLQKRIELWGEGQIFFDWKRMGWPITRGYAGTNHCTGYRYNTTTLPTWYTWVITRNEVMNNVAIVGKNNPDPAYNMVEWTGQ